MSAAGGGALVDAMVEAGDWSACGDVAALAEAAAVAALEEIGLSPAAIEVSVLFTDDAEIADLNGRFRGKPSPTNVLSWPAAELRPSAPGAKPAAPRLARGQRTPIGDIALAAETVAREAQERNLALRDHAAHLVMHGLLHCLGYDHETDADAALMEGVESRAMARLGLSDPYG